MVNESQADGDSASPRGSASWIPRDCASQLRALLRRHLAGEGALDAEVGRLAQWLAREARAQEIPSERVLIAIRSLWTEQSLSHSDRLQASDLYESIVRRAIESYYR